MCVTRYRSPATGSAPGGVPVGLEILGPEWSEPPLRALAYAGESTMAAAMVAPSEAFCMTRRWVRP